MRYAFYTRADCSRPRASRGAIAYGNELEAQPNTTTVEANCSDVRFGSRLCENVVLQLFVIAPQQVPDRIGASSQMRASR